MGPKQPGPRSRRVPKLCGFTGVGGSGWSPRLAASLFFLSTFGEGISSFPGPAGQVSTQMESPTQGPPEESSPWKLHGAPARHRDAWLLADLPGARPTTLPAWRGGAEGAAAGLSPSWAQNNVHTLRAKQREAECEHVSVCVCAFGRVRLWTDPAIAAPAMCPLNLSEPHSPWLCPS